MAEHGGSGGMYTRGCRCAPCRAANTRRCRERRLTRKRNTQLSGGVPDTVQHGKSCYTNWGCRCDVCVVDHSAYLVARRRRIKERTAADHG